MATAREPAWNRLLAPARCWQRFASAASRVLVGGNFSSFDGQDRPGLVAIVRSGP